MMQAAFPPLAPGDLADADRLANHLTPAEMAGIAARLAAIARSLDAARRAARRLGLDRSEYLAVAECLVFGIDDLIGDCRLLPLCRAIEEAGDPSRETADQSAGAREQARADYRAAVIGPLPPRPPAA